MSRHLFRVLPPQHPRPRLALRAALLALLLFAPLLYGAWLAGANPVRAATALPDAATLKAMREGDMRKLAILDAPRPLPNVAVTDIDGNPHRLSEFRGKLVLLNMWATWCAPCRAEMPGLDALQARLGGDDFQVVLVAVGRNPPAAIRRFFSEVGIRNLESLRDPKMQLAAPLGVFGLPVTLLVDPEGREVARLVGDATWDSPEAERFLKVLLGRDAG